MSMKRAMNAGAKPSKATSRANARVSNRPDKCARPGCSSPAKSHGVCRSAVCQAWYVAD